MRCIPFIISAILCAPLTVHSQPVNKLGRTVENASCGPDAPGYECFSKRELWTTSVRFEGKWKDEQLAHAGTKVKLAGAEKKLAVRTSTAIRNLVVPPSSSEPEGHSTSTLVLYSGLALVAGIVVGAIVLSKNEPSTIVVK